MRALRPYLRLSRGARCGTSFLMTVPDMFSRVARRRFRDRACKSAEDDRWLIRAMSEELLERLDLSNITFVRALIIGNDGGHMAAALIKRAILVMTADAGSAGARVQYGVQCDEDRLPFADHSFDLIIAIGTLDSVNDLPGALTLIRRMLMPEGLFLAAMPGAGSLATLKSALIDSADGLRHIVRHHPQIDVRAAGDLLARTGFQLPVADTLTITARYPDVFRLISDLRANGFTNALLERFGLRRDRVAQIANAFSNTANDKIEETFAIIFMTGWSPSKRSSLPST